MKRFLILAAITLSVSSFGQDVLSSESMGGMSLERLTRSIDWNVVINNTKREEGSIRTYINLGESSVFLETFGEKYEDKLDEFEVSITQDEAPLTCLGNVFLEKEDGRIKLFFLSYTYFMSGIEISDSVRTQCFAKVLGHFREIIGNEIETYRIVLQNDDNAKTSSQNNSDRNQEDFTNHVEDRLKLKQNLSTQE